MAAEFKKAEEVVKIAQPADLIEFDRGIYQHWAIYVGDGDIVNFGSDPGSDPGSASGSGSGSGSVLESVTSLSTQNKSKVKREKLTDVAHSDLCRVNNRLDHKYPPRVSKLILRDALQMVDQVVPYSVVSWNCEHFVTGLRYCKPESAQIWNAIKAALEVSALSALVALGATLVASLKENKEESDKTEKKQEQQKD